MPSRWLDALKQEESKHNTAAALRERQNRRRIGPVEKLKTPINPPSKTSNTLPEGLNFPENGQAPPSKTSNTDKTPEAEHLGLVATWSLEFGFISLHDPTTGEWHDLATKDAPGWAVGEARRRKELYRAGNRKAYRLTSREMEEVWEDEQVEMWDHPAITDRGIVYEDYLEED